MSTLTKKIKLKTDREIEIMKEGGRRLRQVVKKILPLIKKGVTTEEIDFKTERLIKDFGGQPSFKTVKGYQWATCLSINNQVVHTPPSKRKLKKGDILTIDIGMMYQGYHTDWATTVIVDDDDFQLKRFLEAGKKALYQAIDQFKIGNYIGNISATIEKEILKKGYFVIKELTGHGVGKKLHEEPFIPGFLDKEVFDTPKIKEGMVLAIEVIYSQNKTTISYENENHWSLVTEDGSLAACFEHTVALLKNGPLILT